MSLPPEVKQLHTKKGQLLVELQSLREREEALNIMIEILQEKLAVQRSSPTSLPKDHVEWSASPEKVLELYHK